LIATPPTVGVSERLDIKMPTVEPIPVDPLKPITFQDNPFRATMASIKGERLDKIPVKLR
jgi:hypothetical protein